MQDMALILWLIAVVLAVVGVVQLIQGQILLGIILLIVAAAVGPGGWSVFRGRSTVSVRRDDASPACRDTTRPRPRAGSRRARGRRAAGRSSRENRAPGGAPMGM
jgi:hypothetical protein